MHPLQSPRKRDSPFEISVSNPGEVPTLGLTLAQRAYSLAASSLALTLSERGCYQGCCSCGAPLIHPNGSAKIPIIPSNLAGIMFSRICCGEEQIT